MSTPSYASDPQIQFLSQVLDEIAEGHLLVPRFQRPMVWTDEQRLELMRSVAQSTPVGSIFVWRTRERIATYENLGPYRLALSETGDFFNYLIDGHQRLSTLFGALRTPVQKELEPFESAQDEVCWEIVYDLEEEEFHLANDVAADAPPTVVSMRVVLDSIASMRFQRGLIDDPRGEVFLERLERLTAAFQRFKIATIPIVTDELDQVTRIFQRINSQGTSMSQLHMLHALTWSDSFNLNQRVEEIREEHLGPLGWSEIGDQSILMACKLALGLDVYEGNIEAISAELRSKSGILEDATFHLIEGIEFLRKNCGIGSPKLLPYESLLPLLSNGLSSAETRDDELTRRLIYWFWWTTYIGFAGGSNTSRIRRAGENVRQLARGEDLGDQMRPHSEVPPPPRRYDFRHARSKVLALHLARHRRHVEGNSKSLDALNEDGAAMVQMLVPRKQARTMGALEFDQLDALLRSTANRVVAAPSEMGAIWSTETMPPRAAEAHLIPSAMPATLEELQVFLEERRARLDDLETSFLRNLGILGE